MLKRMLRAASSEKDGVGTFVNPFDHAHLTRMSIRFRNTGHPENRLWRNEKAFSVVMHFSSGKGTTGQQEFEASSWPDLERQVEAFFIDIKS